jgi:two-component system response regulator CpxR
LSVKARSEFYIPYNLFASALRDVCKRRLSARSKDKSIAKQLCRDEKPKQNPGLLKLMMNKLLVIHTTLGEEFLREQLQAAGFEIETVTEIAQGITRALSGEHALAIVGLPDVRGLEVLRRLRQESLLPVLLLAERATESERILSFELGADDYLPVPFAPEELLARARAILRRTGAGVSAFGHLLKVNELELDRLKRTVKQNGARLTLTTSEFDLLEQLLKRAGQTVSREELAQAILGRPLNANDRSIDVHISNLRRKLGSGERIKAVRGVGYVFTPGAQS